MHAELILDARNAVGESPVWNAHEQALYWVDIPNGRLHRWGLADGASRSWQAPHMLACIARDERAQGTGWIAGMQSGLFSLAPNDDGTLTTHPLVGVTHDQPEMRFNDGRCDRQGRFWAGTMVLDMGLGIPAGKLYRYATHEQAALDAMLDNLIVPNGLAFSPDGRTMYLSDSHPTRQLIWAFDYDIDNGTPSNRRLFVDMNQHPGRPDGAAIDEAGCYWICANDAGLVLRFTPDGRLDRALPLPVKKPAMCAFGGPHLDTLFVTSIRPGGDLEDQPLAGGVFALNPGVKGLEEPRFKG